MSRSAPPKQVRAVAERVAQQPPQVLAVVGQQREVVGDEVARGDRDQRVRERARELAPASCPPAGASRACRACRSRRRSAPRRRGRRRTPSSSAVPMPEPEVAEEALQVLREVVEQRALLRAVERGRADRDDQQRDGADDRRRAAPCRCRGRARAPCRLGSRRAVRASRSARTARRTRRRCAPTAPRRRGSSRRASRRGRRASGSRATRAACRAPTRSSQIANANSHAAAGMRPSARGVLERLRQRAEARRDPAGRRGRARATG